MPPSAPLRPSLRPSKLRAFLREAGTALMVKVFDLLPTEAMDRVRRGAAKLGPVPVPRRRNLTHRARGRLVFLEGGDAGESLPIRHMEVELWDRDVGGPDDLLGRAATDDDGYFDIAYDPADAGPADVPDLDLRVVETSSVSLPRAGASTERRVVHVVRGPDDVRAVDHDFGPCRVPYWPYLPHSPVARVSTGEGLADSLPQDFSAARKSQAYGVVSAVNAIRLRHLARITFGPPVTVAEVQSDYPANRTLELDRRTPGASRSDAWFVERLLNGFNPVLFRKDPTGSLYVSYSYEGYEIDRDHFAPDVRADFDLREGALVPTRITLRRRSAGDAGPGDPVAYTPADGGRWEQAKRVVRVSCGLWGEVQAHLARAHLNMEQYAVSAHRHLRRSPVARLILPHLREVVVINHRASTSLLGEEGFVVVGSALTVVGVHRLLVESVGACDWAGWSPRLPVTEGHTFARVGRLFWALVGDWVDRFFTEHAAEISETWSEIAGMSRDLVAHAAAHVPPGGGDPWVDTSEVNDRDDLRRDVGGVRRAVSEVAGRATADAEGLENLRQMCRYVIFHATFFHSWANDEQHADGGEVAFLSLGLNADVIEDPTAVGLSPFEATTQLYFTWYLTRTRHGLVTRNEEGDIEPGFIEMLKARRAEFTALGYDIDAIRSRINV